MKVGRKGEREGDWGPRFRALFINYRCLTETNSRYNGPLANEDSNSRSLQCPLERELTVELQRK